MSLKSTTILTGCILLVFSGPRTRVVSAQPPSAAPATGTLLIEAYHPDGRTVNLQDFNAYTTYVSSTKWAMNVNYGVFPMGTLPAVKSLASMPTVENRSGIDYIAFQVTSNEPVYFTCLWKADGIGTVFMRADNGGAGYLVANNASRVVQLPYDFALSEFSLASHLQADASDAGYTFSGDLLNASRRAAALVDSARAATTAATRASLSYQALSVVMPLKEQIAVEMSNASIARFGPRPGFELNYEGFGGWTIPELVPNYRHAREAGFTSVFTSCDWNLISPSRGVYDFKILDYQIDQALSLGYRFSLAINQPLGAMPPWVLAQSFEDRKALFFENARRVVDRYRRKVSVFYPHAEPELAVSGHTIEQVAALVQASFDGARAAAPGTLFGLYTSASAYVGYDMNPQADANYYSSWTLLTYLYIHDIKPDFIGLEMQYGTVFAAIDLQRLQEILGAVNDLTQVPLYIGETGYSSKTEDYGIEAQSYWHDGLIQQAQAEWASGTLRIAYGSPFVYGYYWVHLDPEDNDQGSEFLSTLIGTNVFKLDGSPKKAYAMFQQFKADLAAFKTGVFGPLAPAIGTRRKLIRP